MDYLILPGGTTSFLQPLDVVVNKPFKDQMRYYYQKWLANKCLDVKNAGYLKGPNFNDMIEWVTKSRDHLNANYSKHFAKLVSLIKFIGKHSYKNFFVDLALKMGLKKIVRKRKKTMIIMNSQLEISMML